MRSIRAQDERSQAVSRYLPGLMQVRFELRRVAGRRRLYIPYLARKHRALGWGTNSWQAGIVDGDTAFVIEGLPRSANTFALAATLDASGYDPHLRIGHHVCHPGQVAQAARLGVPTLVIARDPQSWLVSALQWNPGVSPRQWLRYYISYCSDVAQIAKAYRSVLVADFGEVTSDFGSVVRRLNAKTGAAIPVFEHTPDRVAAVQLFIESTDRVRFGSVNEGQVSRPSSVRAERANLLTRSFERPDILCRIDEARVRYRNLLESTAL